MRKTNCSPASLLSYSHHILILLSLVKQ